MSRADRLFQIVDQLRRHRFRTARQLARDFEVSERTIYRDVLSLVTSGVPITGEAGVGYHLEPSYKLPPLTFSLDEVEALVTGMRMVETFADDELGQRARAILAKVDAVLPAEQRRKLDTTALFSMTFKEGRAHAKPLSTLRRAIRARRCLRFEYEDERGRSSSREVRPLGLYFWGSSWVLAAYCELRADFRSFRTDRLTNLTTLARNFEAAPPITLDGYVEAVRARDGRDGRRRRRGPGDE